MADRSSALRDKYRATAHDRLRKVSQLLRQSEPPTAQTISQAMAELHAVKGESSMVGFDAMSQLAHALETYVGLSTSTGDLTHRAVADAIDGLVTIFDQPFSSLVQDPTTEELLSEITAAISSATGEVPTKAKSVEAAEPRQQQEAASAAASGSVNEHEGMTRFTRVDSSRIDGLCDSIADLRLNLGRIESDFGKAMEQLSVGAQSSGLIDLRQRFQSLRQELDEVAAGAWALRLVGVAPHLEEVATYAVDLAQSLGKTVETSVRAAGVELERNVLDALNEPLLHIVRNAIDHGIETAGLRGDKSPTARLTLAAESRGNGVLLLVEDDGVGLDPSIIRARSVALELVPRERAGLLTDSEALDLIFMEKFTQRDVASALSGRGVGLSAARRKVESIGGAIRVESTKGQGTRFEINVPSTLSRERVLLVEIARTLCCIPTRWVLSVIGDPQKVAEAKEKHYIYHDGRLLGVRAVAHWMSLEPGKENWLVAVGIAGRDGVLMVDDVLGERDILRLSADPMLALGERVEASGMLDDGGVVLFLRWAEVLRSTSHRRTSARSAPAPLPKTSTVLVVDDSPVIRDIVSEVLVGVGLKVLTAENGLVAVRILESSPCDLVISDVEMPQLSGLELLEHIRKTNDILPVVILTTRSSPETRHKAASLGANAYIVKSEFRGNVLLDVVRRFVELPT